MLKKIFDFPARIQVFLSRLKLATQNWDAVRVALGADIWAFELEYPNSFSL